MDYTRLGATGLEVSRICLGCMSYGEPERGGHAWSLPEEEARPFFRQALDLGVNFFDTANVYSAGSSWSPLARGRLARPWDEETARSEQDEFGRRLYGDEDCVVVDCVGEIAERRGIPRAQVALAWLLAQPGITSPIVGATKPRHLDDAVAALEVRLTPEEIAGLEEPYRPHPILGHQ
jgi:aryl-alcohol dehydrogenase-like predicted oxidoreductase